MIKAIFFDYDGTTMNTNDLIFASWDNLFTELEGVPRPHEVIMPYFGEPVSEAAAKFLPEYDPMEILQKFRAYQKKIYMDRIYPFDGIIDLLKALNQRGIRCFTVTNRMTDMTVDGYAKFGMDQYFEGIIGFEHTERNKPFPDPIYYTLEHYGLEKDEVLMVGDSRFDLMAADAAGVKSVVVDWTIADPEVRSGIQADHHMETPQDLLRILDELNA